MATERGRFIVIEGVEGAGKTTQVARLAEWLAVRGIPHVTGREPGGTPLGEAIRELLLADAAEETPARTELLLVLAARAAFVERVVRPALEAGAVVVADRYELSTLAYQGYGRGLELGEVQRLNAFATGGLEPDLTVVLDVDVDEGLERAAAAGKAADRIEGSGRAFLERVREGYLRLVRESTRAALLDGRGSPEAVHGRIVRLLEERFPETFRVSGG